MPYSDPEVQREYQRQWMARRRAEFFADKSCVICGSTDRMELDHIDPALKVDHKIWSWTESKRMAEIEKCQVLCYFHHKEKTRSEWVARNQHGTYSMRNTYGCRCEECMEFVRRNKRESRARLKAKDNS